MNTSSDAAEQIVRLSLEGFEVAAKITGSGVKDIGAILIATLNSKQKTAGKTKLKNMLKSGKELKVFSVKKENYDKFVKYAKKYGIVYAPLMENEKSDGVIDIAVKAEDASRINRIIDRFKIAEFDETTIRSEVEKQKKEKTSKDKGFKEKSNEDKIKEESNSKPIKKEEQSVNPHLAKTVKSPQSEPSLETQKTSHQGANLKEKPSVKEKLEKAKDEVKNRDKLEASNKTKNNDKNISKGKVKKNERTNKNNRTK